MTDKVVGCFKLTAIVDAEGLLRVTTEGEWPNELLRKTIEEIGLMYGEKAISLDETSILDEEDGEFYAVVAQVDNNAADEPAADEALAMKGDVDEESASDAEVTDAAEEISNDAEAVEDPEDDPADSEESDDAEGEESADDSEESATLDDAEIEEGEDDSYIDIPVDEDVSVPGDDDYGDDAESEEDSEEADVN